MNIWILQDMPGRDLVARLRREASDGDDHWNIKTHFDEIKDNDIVLLWQPSPDANERGICAWGIISGSPYSAPDNQSDWKVNITGIKILTTRLSKRAIDNAGMPELRDLEVILAPGGRRVFPVTAVQWTALQRIRPEFGVFSGQHDGETIPPRPARRPHNRRANWTHCSYVFVAVAIVALLVSAVRRATTVHEKAIEPFSGEDRP